MAFDKSFREIVLIEGGFSDDPADSGGPTNYGITEAVARANGYTGDMDKLPLEFARFVYKAQYWDTMRLDDVSAMSGRIAQELFDTSVNAGISRAGTFLQRALNVLNREQVDYNDVVADGVVGPVTIYALRAYLERRGPSAELVMLRALNVLQGAFYIELAERRQKDERFVLGWLKNRIVIN